MHVGASLYFCMPIHVCTYLCVLMRGSCEFVCWGRLVSVCLYGSESVGLCVCGWVWVDGLVYVGGMVCMYVWGMCVGCVWLFMCVRCVCGSMWGRICILGRYVGVCLLEIGMVVVYRGRVCMCGCDGYRWVLRVAEGLAGAQEDFRTREGKVHQVHGHQSD